MPAAEMIRGRIVGEIDNAIGALRNGMCGRVGPSAASVLNEVAIGVEAKPIMNEFLVEWIHWALDRESAIQAQENGSSGAGMPFLTMSAHQRVE